jgi:hypothetical protein
VNEASAELLFMFLGFCLLLAGGGALIGWMEK